MVVFLASSAFGMCHDFPFLVQLRSETAFCMTTFSKGNMLSWLTEPVMHFVSPSSFTDHGCIVIQCQATVKKILHNLIFEKISVLLSFFPEMGLPWLVYQALKQNCWPQLIYTVPVMDSAAGGRHGAPCVSPTYNI